MPADRHVILAVVYMIGAITMGLCAGIVYASMFGHCTIDNAVSTLAGTALGYLGGLLTRIQSRGVNEPTTSVTVPFVPTPAAPTPVASTTPIPVNVTNDEAHRVPTSPEPPKS